MRNPLRDPNQQIILSLKRRVAGVLCSDRAGQVVDRVFNGRIPSAGCRIDTRSAVVAPSTKAQMLFGIYEGAERRFVQRHLIAADTIVELGTSLGYLSSIALKKCQPGVRFVGIEANPSLIPIARRNIASNAPHADVTIIHGAVDYRTGPGESVSFNVGRQHTGAQFAPEASERTSFTAPAVRLGEILATHEIGEYSLLADIEGAEAGVLLDDPRALDRCSQIIIELHPTRRNGVDLDVATLSATLTSLGFRAQDQYGSVLAARR